MSRLVAIVGPTASGKSALGIELAQKFNGEIIAADSRTVYRYMDIGTAKPTATEMSQVPHHLVDVVNPDEIFTVADFQQQAKRAIVDISGRGKLPLMVGGSGLYVDSVLYDYQFPSSANPSLRAELESLTDNELVAKLRELDAEAAEMVDLGNRRRVIRAIETAGMPKSKSLVLRPETLVLGLTLNKELLQKRIVQRTEKMLGKGLIEEIRQVGEKFGWNNEAMTGPAYKAFKQVVLGAKTTDEAKADFIRGDLRLAKKQMTWFKRNKDIHWLDAEDPTRLLRQSTELVSQFLAS